MKVNHGKMHGKFWFIAAEIGWFGEGWWVLCLLETTISKSTWMMKASRFLPTKNLRFEFRRIQSPLLLGGGPSRAVYKRRKVVTYP